MPPRTYPETVEHRWDILYQDYPEKYDQFSSYPYSPPLVELVISRFGLAGKVVVENGAGTGLATVKMAESARHVYAIDPEPSMRDLALGRGDGVLADNVTFVAGRGEAIPLADGCADVYASFTAGIQSISEAKRVLRRPGLIVALDVAPGCYGGDLVEVLDHPTPELQEFSDLLVKTHGFEYEDVETVQEYGTTQNIVESYGFIFGAKAIDHLRESGQTSIRWTFRLHYLSV